MYKIDFSHPGKAHFIGIGGISMSGFAELLHTMGFTITGSDRTASKITKHLETLGIEVIYEQAAKNITPNIDFVVYTAAISEDNPEFVRAKELGLPMMERASMVGQVMKNYSTAIAVSGTHGKTSTTSITSHILMEAGLDPTISVGGILPAIGGNIRVGGPEFFVTEACEYTNSFLSFYPTMAVILNIEEDHLDFFKDLADIRHSFKLFAERVPAQGAVVINGDIENYQEIIEAAKGKVITFGHSRGNDYSAGDIQYDDYAHPSFDLYIGGEKKERLTLGVAGEHNVYNALAAIAVSLENGISMDAIRVGLAHFTGTNRRFEKKGEVNGFTIIDDYAHHPHEIEATLKTAQNYPHKTLWCIFQPHTYTRTKAFLPQFAEALSLADKVILADIYAARETDTLGISSEDIVKLLKEKGKEAWYLPTFDEIEKFVMEHCTQGDLLITMGAGDVVNVGENLLAK